MSKYYYITTFIILLLVSYLGITYSYEYVDGVIKFELVGDYIKYVDVYSEYEEEGVLVYRNNKDISGFVKIEDNINMNKLGEYKVRYSIGNEYINRVVRVVDRERPQIELVGGEEISILVSSNYYEYGYKVKDNYDKNLGKRIEIKNNIDNNKIGSYYVEYKVEDSSGNVGIKRRKVNVVEPNIGMTSSQQGIRKINEYNLSRYSNTIIKNYFIDKGIYYEGYSNDSSGEYKIILKNRDNGIEKIYKMDSDKDNYYYGEIRLDNILNGTYDLYIEGSDKERLINGLDVYSKIVRGRVGDKLISVIYQEDLVSIKIDSFKYEYDIVIDSGHGGYDVGASNGVILEKDLNLQISKYEKCRYESMGYRVYMTRSDDTYGEMLGSTELEDLYRRALTIGYYGSVSKIVYSNHHNGSINKKDSGFEVIVGNQMSKDDLKVELLLVDKYKKLYNINEGLRIYSRDYETGSSYDKSYGSINNNVNYYAIIRIPYELYRVNTIIYEPIYLSNINDFNWYYNKRRWIEVSELKIKEYVNYLGGNYKKENNKCMGEIE